MYSIRMLRRREEPVHATKHTRRRRVGVGAAAEARLVEEPSSSPANSRTLPTACAVRQYIRRVAVSARAECGRGADDSPREESEPAQTGGHIKKRSCTASRPPSTRRSMTQYNIVSPVPICALRYVHKSHNTHQRAKTGTATLPRRAGACARHSLSRSTRQCRRASVETYSASLQRPTIWSASVAEPTNDRPRPAPKRLHARAHTHGKG